MAQDRFPIMVVGSQPAARMLICSQLRQLGHDVLTSVPDVTAAQSRLAVAAGC